LGQPADAPKFVAQKAIFRTSHFRDRSSTELKLVFVASRALKISFFLTNFVLHHGDAFDQYLVVMVTLVDEGMTNGPPIFAYLVFGPRRISLEWLLKPIKATV
jgi:hypothetical protein